MWVVLALACVLAFRLLMRFTFVIAGMARWLERWTRVRKVASSNPGRSDGRIFSAELTFCADSYSVSVPSVLPQWHVKTPVILPKVPVAGYT